jgi:SSS family solute:Na+ symporter/sodium/pantothenate symporter
MTIAGVDAIFGFGGGLIGLLLNVAICVVGSRMAPASREQVAEAERATALSAAGT